MEEGVTDEEDADEEDDEPDPAASAEAAALAQLQRLDAELALVLLGQLRRLGQRFDVVAHQRVERRRLLLEAARQHKHVARDGVLRLLLLPHHRLQQDQTKNVLFQT